MRPLWQAPYVGFLPPRVLPKRGYQQDRSPHGQNQLNDVRAVCFVLAIVDKYDWHTHALVSKEILSIKIDSYLFLVLALITVITC